MKREINESFLDSEMRNLKPLLHLNSKSEDDFFEFESARLLEERFRAKRPLKSIVTIYEYVGKPEYRHREEISDSDLSTEVERLVELFLDHRIELLFREEISLNERYRFITEEFLEEPLDEVPREREVFTYWYEMFYPDRIGYYKEYSEDILREIFCPGSKSFLFSPHEKILFRGKRQGLEEVLKTCLPFSERFREPQIIGLAFYEVNELPDNLFQLKFQLLFKGYDQLLSEHVSPEVFGEFVYYSDDPWLSYLVELNLNELLNEYI